MDQLLITFEVSRVQTWIFIPPLVAFVVSFFTSMGGVSGAFLLLPFQVSVLGYVSPSVSGTNQLFNVIAIPGGVVRYVKEKRMVWPLTWAVVIGTLPGVFIGAWVRVRYLPDPVTFKFFAGLVLGYIGLRLLLNMVKERTAGSGELEAPGASRNEMEIENVVCSARKISFSFNRAAYSFSVPALTCLCFSVGIVGGIYGIGGGAIIAPVLVTFFGLPVYAVAGAALMGTFVTSIAGVIFFQILALFYQQLQVAPDFFLGSLFGIGGLAGMYCGARCQRYVPATMIKLVLFFCVMFVSVSYILAYFTTP
jgi:uncharacterized membrane protein YfcA